MNVSGGDATSLKKTTAVASNTTDPGFIISVVNTGIIFLGLALGTVGVYLLVSAEYTPPPAPAAYVVGNAIVIFGASLCLQALLFLITVLSVEGSTPENSAGVTSHAFVCAWGVALIIFGVVRFLSDNPFDYLADCPCPPFHAEIGGGVRAVPWLHRERVQHTRVRVRNTRSLLGDNGDMPVRVQLADRRKHDLH